MTPRQLPKTRTLFSREDLPVSAFISPEGNCSKLLSRWDLAGCPGNTGTDSIPRQPLHQEPLSIVPSREPVLSGIGSAWTERSGARLSVARAPASSRRRPVSQAPRQPSPPHPPLVPQGPPSSRPHGGSGTHLLQKCCRRSVERGFRNHDDALSHTCSERLRRRTHPGPPPLPSLPEHPGSSPRRSRVSRLGRALQPTPTGAAGTHLPEAGDVLGLSCASPA